MHQSLFLQKQRTREILIELYEQIVKAFQQIAPAQKFKDPKTLNDEDLADYSSDLYVFVLGDVMKLPKYGVTEAVLNNFTTTRKIFELILHAPAY